MTEQRKMYDNKFLPLYNQGKYEEASILLIENPEIKDLLLKKELRGIVDFYESLILKQINGALDGVKNSLDKLIGGIKN